MSSVVSFFFFSSPTFSIGIDVDAKTRTRVWKSSSRRIVPPLARTLLALQVWGLNGFQKGDLAKSKLVK